MKKKGFSIGRLLAKLGAHPRHWEDVSNDPQLEGLIGKRFRLTSPLFLINMGGIYCLEPPGRAEGVPATIEDYQQHPNSWWETDAYRALVAPLKPDPRYTFPIIALVPAGATLVIRKITLKQGGVFGLRLTVFASLEQESLKQHWVCCGTVMAGLVGGDPNPTPRTHLIEPVG